MELKERFRLGWIQQQILAYLNPSHGVESSPLVTKAEDRHSDDLNPSHGVESCVRQLSKGFSAPGIRRMELKGSSGAGLGCSGAANPSHGVERLMAEIAKLEKEVLGIRRMELKEYVRAVLYELLDVRLVESVAWS